jgi:hypothetical protein
MHVSLFAQTPPIIPPSLEHVKPLPCPRRNHPFETKWAPSLTTPKPFKEIIANCPLVLQEDTFHVDKAQSPFYCSLSADETDVKAPIKTEETASQEALQLKAKILEGNKVLAAFQEEAKAASRKHSAKKQAPEPNQTNLVLLSKSEDKNRSGFFKKIPIPFHSAGIPKDLIRNFLQGQLNPTALKNYLANRFTLHFNHAKFSITHFHEGDNLHFTESSLQFTKQEKTALAETARAYGYDPNDAQEMAKYYKELLQIQAEIKGDNKTQEWGIAFQYKKGILKTKPLKLPD